MENAVETMAEFISLILETEIESARLWLESFQRGFPKHTIEAFGQFAITENAVESIAYGISVQISRTLRQPEVLKNKEVYSRLYKNGHDFLQEIFQKGTQLGLELKADQIDWIFAPDAEKMATAS